jgi:hypothetical protein
VTGNRVGWDKLATSERRPTRLRAAVGRRTLCVLVPPYIVLLAFAGCGTTQLSSNSRHLLEALQTAVSAKNDQWLEAAAKQVEEQRSKGQMSEPEHQALASIIDLAKAGKWDAAQSRVFALSEAQRPTAEDLARVQKRSAK